jgi:glycosyltransferase involved in cell wall biosynthesis
MMGVTTIILTHNEERHIERAIRSVLPFAEKVIVVDSKSSDLTVEIAESLGAIVLQNPFVHQAQQFQWALDNAPIVSDRIMRLDADEVIEPDLAARIAAELPKLPMDVAGVNLKRKHIFMGRFIRHGGRYPLLMLRIWRRGQGRIEQRWMDEHVIVSGGGTVTFDGGFADHNLSDLTFFTDKHNTYATREAVDILNRRYRLFDVDEGLSAKSASMQASLKRAIKEKVYNRLPFWMGSFGYFTCRYFLQLGFLDGREGLIYHFLQGFWYRFLVGAKVEEFDRILAPLPDGGARRTALSRLTGYKLD